MAASRFRSHLVGIAYWLSVALLSVAFAEFTLWWWWRSKMELSLTAPGIDYSLRFVLDDEILYRLLPDPTHHINSAGFRDSEFLPKGARKRVAVIGDSYPMGIVVPPEKTFPKVAEQLTPDVEFLNLGIQGYGPDQELVAYHRFARQLTPDHVVWSIYPSNDYHDLIKNQLFETEREGDSIALRRTKKNLVQEIEPSVRLVTLFHILSTGKPLPDEKAAKLQAYFFSDSQTPHPLTRDTIELMRAIMQAMSNAVTKDGAKLTVLIIPSLETVQGARWKDFNLDAETAEIARELGLNTIDLSNEFIGHPEFYSATDRHLSEMGHMQVAEAIVNRCNCT